MSTKIRIALVVLVIAFTGLGAHNLITSKRAEDNLKKELQYQQTEKAKTLQQLEKTQDDHTKTLEQKQQLEQKTQEQDQKIKELEQQLSVRRENARKLANAVTGTATASAATPTGSGCEWLSGQLVAAGLSSGEISAALNIASRESGCRQTAVNPGSGACNVFQELPCGKWGGGGNLAAHIAGATQYANARYGGWQGAWAAWQSKHWW